MLRQLLTVALGFVISFLAFAGSGYLLYRLSDAMPGHQLGLLVRYIFGPCVALLVGACVGALAKSRPGLLAVLSLAPLWIQPLLLPQRPDAAYFLTFISFVVPCLFIGAAAAIFVFRRRGRESAPASS